LCHDRQESDAYACEKDSQSLFHVEIVLPPEDRGRLKGNNTTDGKGRTTQGNEQCDEKESGDHERGVGEHRTRLAHALPEKIDEQIADGKPDK
jgi:hypothetical protein